MFNFLARHDACRRQTEQKNTEHAKRGIRFTLAESLPPCSFTNPRAPSAGAPNISHASPRGPKATTVPMANMERGCLSNGEARRTWERLRLSLSADKGHKQRKLPSFNSAVSRCLFGLTRALRRLLPRLSACQQRAEFPPAERGPRPSSTRFPRRQRC